MKHLFLVCAMALALFSCNENDDLTNSTPTSEVSKSSARLQNGENVKLLEASQSYVPFGAPGRYNPSGQPEGYSRTFYADVKNLGYAKKVIIHHKMSNGSWKDFNLTYDRVRGGVELWKGSFFIPVSSVYFGEEFVVKYEVNGQTYWDNNNGKNYYLKQSTKNTTYNSILYNDRPKVLLTSSWLYYGQQNGFTPEMGNYISINTSIQNIAYQKEVTLVYTSDKWITKQTLKLSYTGTSPVDSSQESWSILAKMPQNITAIEFAIVYKVNGIEYWDNNYGENYKAKIGDLPYSYYGN